MDKEDLDVFNSPSRERINSLQKQNKNRSFRRGESTTSILINSYQPTIITEKRRRLEDLCRDLVVNNDHIHVVEQRMRVAIDQVAELTILFSFKKISLGFKQGGEQEGLC